MYFQVQFGPIDYCLDWDVSLSFSHAHTHSPLTLQTVKATRVENQLQSYLIRIIHSNCSECEGLTTSFLRRGLFLCHGNPTKATYRSTLINPLPTTNATQLVGIIQSWVSRGPSLILDCLLVRVSGHCPTAISSLDEAECKGDDVTTDPELGARITQTIHICAVRNFGRNICHI